MARLSKENEQLWMKALARKHGIDVETVEGVYNGMEGKGKHRRTVEFFELYFEGIKEEKK